MEELNKSKKTEQKRGKIDRETSEVSKPKVREIISFDAYFRLLMTRNSQIRPHHRVPMKEFVKRVGLVEATKEDFDKVLSKY
jgi:hypothetical protein